MSDTPVTVKVWTFMVTRIFANWLTWKIKVITFALLQRTPLKQSKKNTVFHGQITGFRAAGVARKNSMFQNTLQLRVRLSHISIWSPTKRGMDSLCSHELYSGSHPTEIMVSSVREDWAPLIKRPVNLKYPLLNYQKSRLYKWWNCHRNPELLFTGEILGLPIKNLSSLHKHQGVLVSHCLRFSS